MTYPGSLCLQLMHRHDIFHHHRLRLLQQDNSRHGSMHHENLHNLTNDQQRCSRGFELGSDREIFKASYTDFFRYTSVRGQKSSRGTQTLVGSHRESGEFGARAL